MTAETNRTGAKAYLPWIIAAIAVAALAVSLLWDRGQPDRAGDTDLAQLTERLDALESGTGGNVPGPGGARPATGGRAGASLQGPSELGAMAAQKSPEEMATEREQKLRALEAQFARDVTDPVGGPATEDTLVDTISSETMSGTGLKPNDVDIACKQNSCRIVGSFDRMGDAQDWSLFYITAAGGNVLSQTQMVFVPLPGGGTEVRIFSNRAGR